MKRNLLPLLVVSLPSATLLGCGSSASTSGPSTAATLPPASQVSAAAHMSPEATAAKNAAGGR